MVIKQFVFKHSGVYLGKSENVDAPYTVEICWGGTEGTNKYKQRKTVNFQTKHEARKFYDGILFLLDEARNDDVTDIYPDANYSGVFSKGLKDCADDRILALAVAGYINAGDAVDELTDVTHEQANYILKYLDKRDALYGQKDYDKFEKWIRGTSYIDTLSWL
jgi:hypothetical protein